MTRKRRRKAPQRGPSRPGRRDAWRRAAAAAGAELRLGSRPDEDEIVLHHRVGEIRLETKLLMVGTTPVYHTRAVATFSSAEAPALEVRQSGFLRRILRRVAGGPGRSSSLPGLGPDFSVRTSDLSRARQIAGSEVARAFAQHPGLDLRIGRAARRMAASEQDPNYFVRVQVLGITSDPDLLLTILRLMVAVLDGLLRSGMASARA